jgi:hypothetical protein
MMRFLGRVSVAVAIPVLAQAMAALDIPGLQGEIAALVNLIINYQPPTLAASFQFVARLLAQLQVSAEPPALTIQVELIAKLALLKVRLEFLLQVVSLLTRGGIQMYEYEGQAGSFGSELTATLAGPEPEGGVPAGDRAYALVLLGTGSSTIETLKLVKGGL